MDDSMFTPLLLSSSAHLENVEQLIRNLEKQAYNHDDRSNNHNNPESIHQTFSSLSPKRSSYDTNHFITTISLPDDTTITNRLNEHHSADIPITSHDLYNNDPIQKQQTSPINDQDGGYIWDDQYDTRANYRLTYSTDKTQQIHVKSDKSRRHKPQSISGQKPSLTYSDEDMSPNIVNHVNDWSMRSSFNLLEQSINQPHQIHNHSNPPSSSSQQQQQHHSSGSSTTSSSTSWRQMKESHRTTTGLETKETRPPSPLNLFKIFQQKSNVTVPTLTRPLLPINPRQNDLILPEKSKSSESHLNTDQAIQTSILFNTPSSSRYRTKSVTVPKSEILTHLIPSTPSVSTKSLPDLSFISQYSKELPRSRPASPTTSTINITRTTPSPILIQHQKSDSDRPRTLKSIKRYKNSKHSTEPLNVFFSPQLRKTFATVPTSTLSSSPSEQQTSNLKPCLKYSSRANSCDIHQITQDYKSSIPEFTNNKELSVKRRNTETNVLEHPSKIHSNTLTTYILPDSFRGHRSEHDLTTLIDQDNSAKKSVSFSEDISKHSLSPCNPTIAFNDNLPLTFDENNERRTTTIRSKDMCRCQTDIIVVDPVLHLHSFTDSPPNEFCLQRDDDDDEEEKQPHINIIPNLDEPVPIINTLPSSPLTQIELSSIDKENKVSVTMETSSFDNLVETISQIIKRIFEIKRSDKAFFLDNEQNPQLDSLLKNDLCSAIKDILEHGRRDLKKVTLWKIIEASIDKNTSTFAQVPRVYCEAKQTAQNTSSHWLYKFQAFIFALLNKNELINWLYYFTRQKDIVHHYYQSPDALILVATSSTFNLFERLMTQLEKLAPLAFRLTYHIPTNSSIIDDPLNSSMISNQSTKSSARDWVMTISRRSSKTLTQPVMQVNANDTFRSTLSRRFNALFTKTNTPSLQSKPPTLVPTKLLEPQKQIKSPLLSHRPRFSSVFNNSSGTISSPKLTRPPVRQNTPPSVGLNTTIQSKIPRPSLNVDKPKSVRYRSAVSSHR